MFDFCPLDGRGKEFFEVKGVYSMRNLTIFLTIANGCLLLDTLALLGKIAPSVFFECYSALLLAGGGVYGIGKLQDEKTNRTQIENQADESSKRKK
jgi:hypothetical protein